MIGNKNKRSKILLWLQLSSHLLPILVPTNLSSRTPSKLRDIGKDTTGQAHAKDRVTLPVEPHSHDKDSEWDRDLFDESITPGCKWHFSNFSSEIPWDDMSGFFIWWSDLWRAGNFRLFPSILKSALARILQLPCLPCEQDLLGLFLVFIKSPAIRQALPTPFVTA